MFSTIKQQFKELIKKTKFEYYLLWEGNRKYLYCLKKDLNDNKILQREIFELESNGPDNRESIREILKNVGYMKDEVILLLSGPEVFQKILIIENIENNLEETLIDLRESIWPRSVPDYELTFDYKILYSDENKSVLYIAFVKKDTLKKIRSFCEEIDALPAEVSSNLGILFTADESQLKTYIENGFILRGNSIIEGLEWQSENMAIIKSNRIINANFEKGNNKLSDSGIIEESIDDKLCSYSVVVDNDRSGIIIFDDCGTSKKRKIYDFCLNHFRKGILLLLSIFIVLTIFNIYLSVRESVISEVLQEYQFKQNGIERLQAEYAELKDKSVRYSYVMRKKLRISWILCDFGKLKPEQMWLRRLNFTNIGKVSSLIRLYGLSYGDKEILEYYKILSEVKAFSNIKLSDLSHVSSDEAGKIPNRYKQNLFRFILELDKAK